MHVCHINHQWNPNGKVLNHIKTKHMNLTSLALIIFMCTLGRMKTSNVKQCRVSHVSDKHVRHIFNTILLFSMCFLEIVVYNCLMSCCAHVGVSCPCNIVVPSVLNIGYRRYIGRQNYIPDTG